MRLAPLMMHEACEEELEEALDRLARREWLSEPHERLEDFGQVASVKTMRDEIQTLKIQLFSLGVIDQCIRRRGLTDTNTYWTNIQSWSRPAYATSGNPSPRVRP